MTPHQISLDRGQKRSIVSLSTGHEPIFPKKPRHESPVSVTDNEFSNCLNSIVNESQLSLSPCSTDSFNFGDMVHGFDSDPCINVPDNAPHSMLDSFLIDLPISSTPTTTPAPTRNESYRINGSDPKEAPLRLELTSPISSSSNLPQSSNIQVPEPRKLSLISTSPVSSTTRYVSPTSVSPKKEQGGNIPGDRVAVDMDQFHEKRMADRAARNRESSRRAREKAKQRLRMLESQNRMLLETLQNFKIENQELHYQLNRTQSIQQNCSMCSFAAANSRGSPGQCMAQPAGVSGTISNHGHGVMRMDRCTGEKCRPQIRMNPSFSSSV